MKLRKTERLISTRQYVRLVSIWVESIGLDPRRYWDPLYQSHKSSIDIYENRELESSSIVTWSLKVREYRQISRN